MVIFRKISHTVGCSVTYFYTLLVPDLGESSPDSQTVLPSRLYWHLPNCIETDFHPILLQITSTRFSTKYVLHTSPTILTYTPKTFILISLKSQPLMSLYITLASHLPHLFHFSGHVSVAVYPWGPHLSCCNIKMTAHPDNPGQCCHGFDNRRLYLSH